MPFSFLSKLFPNKLPNQIERDNSFRGLIIYGYSKRLNNLVKKKPTKINTYSDSGFTPLQYSLVYEQYECTVFLLEHGANPNSRYACKDSHEKTIQSSIDNDKRSIVRLLAIYGADEEQVYFSRSREETKTCFFTTRELYKTRCKLEEQRKELTLAQGPLSDIATCCLAISKIWEQLKNAEIDNLIFKKHYEEKQWYYQELANEPERLLESMNNTTQANEATPLLQS